MTDRDEVFYRDGLAFECQRCSACCRFDPGFVFLSQEDLDSLCEGTGLPEEEFIAVYCRWVPWPGGLEILSLKEKSNNDCIFWGENGCEVYQHRPFQCSSYPFWDSIMRDPAAWKDCGRDCPGVGKGSKISYDRIESLLNMRMERAYLTRDTGEETSSH